MRIFHRPLRGSITPAPRTPETQQLSSTRGGTLFFSQQVAAVVGGARIGEAPGAAAPVALAARRADCRIAVADLEAQVVAADAVEADFAPALDRQARHGSASAARSMIACSH